MRPPATRSASHSGSSPTTAGALGADRPRRAAQVRAQLRRRASASRAACGNGSGRRHGRLGHARASPRGAAAHAGCAARASPPPMCIRHELSHGADLRPCRLDARSLSASMAAETSAFLTANVPPKPQHSSAVRQLAQVDARAPPAAAATAGRRGEHAQRVAARVVRHARAGTTRRRPRPRARRRAAPTARRRAARARDGRRQVASPSRGERADTARARSPRTTPTATTIVSRLAEDLDEALPAAAASAG